MITFMINLRQVKCKDVTLYVYNVHLKQHYRLLSFMLVEIYQFRRVA